MNKTIYYSSSQILGVDLYTFKLPTGDIITITPNNMVDFLLSLGFKCKKSD